MQGGNLDAAIEIPPGFGRDVERGRPAWVSAWVDGAMPFRAETIRGYLQGMHQLYLNDPAVKTTIAAVSPPADIEIRFKYNQDFDSIYAMVPSSISLLLALFPAILMALAIVAREGTRLDHQPVCDTGHAARIPDRQATTLYRRRDGEFCLDVPDGLVCLSGAAQGKLSCTPHRRAPVRPPRRRATAW